MSEVTRFVEKGALASSVAMYVFGAMGTTFLPLLVLAAGQQSGLTEAQQARLAFLDLSGYVVGTCVAAAALSRVSWRTLAGAGVTLVMVFNLVGYVSDSFQGIVAARFVAEIGSGLAVALAVAAFSYSRKPDRSYAIALAILMSVSWATLLVLPRYLSVWGAGTIYIAHLVCALIVLPFVTAFPRAGFARLGADGAPMRTQPVLFIALLAICLFMIAEGAVWALAGVVGSNIGISNDAVGSILAWSMLAAFLGAAAAGALSTRYGRLPPVGAGLVLFGASLLLLLFASTKTFIAGMILSQMLFGFVPPYLALNCMDYDASGRFAAFLPAIQIFGYAVGPAIVSLFIASAGAAAVVYVGVTVVAGSLLLSLPLARRLDARAALRQ